MNYQEIAKLIPREYREEILKTNMIANAQGIPSDNSMHYLHTIYVQFIDHGMGDCGVCYQTVLKNFRELQGDLVALSKQEALLNEI